MYSVGKQKNYDGGTMHHSGIHFDVFIYMSFILTLHIESNIAIYSVWNTKYR